MPRMVAHLFQKTFFSVLLLTSTLVCEGAIKHARPKIKVKIGSDLRQLKITGAGLVKKDLLTSKVKTYKGTTSVYFNCRPRQLSEKRSPSVLVASLTASDGLVNWNDSAYKGDLKVVTNEDHSGCDLINEVELDDYIASLLSNEMNEKWHMEALKAQAVAARTYAYQKLKTQSISKGQEFQVPYDIIDSERYQVSGGFHDATPRTIAASTETSGEILMTKGGLLRPIFYHADCGGMTYLPSEVWGINDPAYKAVKCLNPNRKKVFSWDVAVSTQQWIRFLRWYKRVNRIKGSLDQIRLVSDKMNRGYLKVYFDSLPLLIPKSQFRRFYGHKKIPSNRFVLKRVGRYYKVHGLGRGHGVGMSQIGALYMAKDGWNYRQILKHFYPNFVIKKIY